MAGERNDRPARDEREGAGLGAFLSSSLRKRSAPQALPGPTTPARPARAALSTDALSWGAAGPTLEASLLGVAPAPRRHAHRRAPGTDLALTRVDEGPPPRVTRLAYGASVLLHAAVLITTTWLLTRAATSQPPPPARPAPSAQSETIEVDLDHIKLPSMALAGDEVSQVEVPDQEGVAARASGPEGPARPDGPAAGKGGDDEAREQAQNLAQRDDGVSLTRQEQSRLDRSQVQRLDVGPDRASNEDRRATLNPMQVTFLASGKGKRQERRPEADIDPAQGALRGDTPQRRGGPVGGPALAPGEGERRRDVGTDAAGGPRDASASGVLSDPGKGPPSASAAIGFGRPAIAEGKPMVPASEAGKTRDNRDASQEVASSSQSIVEASTAGGRPGEGKGGERAPGDPGAGGDRGAGSTSKVLGQGGKGPVDLDGSDPRLSTYRRIVTQKIYPLWEHAFPKWAALEGRGGLAVIGFTIMADGRVTNVYVMRPSGIAEFDENVKNAVIRAAPFPPLPPNLNARSMKWFMTFDMLNPAVR